MERGRLYGETSVFIDPPKGFLGGLARGINWTSNQPGMGFIRKWVPLPTSLPTSLTRV